MTIHNFSAHEKRTITYFGDFTIPTDPLNGIRREINRVHARAIATADDKVRYAALTLLADLAGRRRQYGIDNGRWR